MEPQKDSERYYEECLKSEVNIEKNIEEKNREFKNYIGKRRRNNKY